MSASLYPVAAVAKIQQYSERSYFFTIYDLVFYGSIFKLFCIPDATIDLFTYRTLKINVLIDFF
jgi:hypothetical protein